MSRGFVFNRLTKAMQPSKSAIVALLLLLSMVAVSPSASAQDSGLRPELGIDFNFNHTDVMLGGLAGLNFPAANASVFATFKGRIGTKRVLIEADERDVFYQYRERRYLLGLQAEKRFLLNEFSESMHFGAFVAGIGGLGFGDYRGTKAEAPVGFAWSAEAGAYITDPSAVVVRLGYQYLPMQTQNVFDHRILLSFTFFIN